MTYCRDLSEFSSYYHGSSIMADLLVNYCKNIKAIFARLAVSIQMPFFGLLTINVDAFFKLIILSFFSTFFLIKNFWQFFLVYFQIFQAFYFLISNYLIAVYHEALYIKLHFGFLFHSLMLMLPYFLLGICNSLSKQIAALQTLMPM